jgi:hypothetical protein
VSAANGEQTSTLAGELKDRPGIDMVTAFGTSLHVSGRDRGALEAAIAPYRQRKELEWQRAAPSLEDVFIDLRQGQLPMSASTRALSFIAAIDFWRRAGAMMRKEFLQLRRDRITFATMITIPLIQLILFGYAINTTPRDLPTAVLLQESSDGFLFPFLGMPAWAQRVGEFLPLTHFLRIVRAIMLKGSTLAQLQYDTLALAGLMALAMVIAVTRFRRTLD